MKVFKTVSGMREWSLENSCRGSCVSLVPTMGALHRAHRSLIRRSVSENDETVVSVFVNPTQFGPGEDYEKYPRDFEADRRICEEEGVSALFNPPVEEMYDDEQFTLINVEGLTRHMCGAHRPGHFRGVALVVAKLFNIVRPQKAYFGRKDYQQLQVIKKLNGDLKFGVEIVGCNTVREKDGLALSSRNRYLDDEEREQASHIYKTLFQAAQRIREGERDAEKINKYMRKNISENMPRGRIDYSGVYHSCLLKPVKSIETDVVVAAAVHVGRARLIDNLTVRID